MAVFFNEGEEKTRPGLYQRYSNIGESQIAGARNGYCAAAIQSHWGPLGVVVTNERTADIAKNYGSGTYGTGYTATVAERMFKGGASIVYTYRMGTGGAAAALTSGDFTFTAKYPGDYALAISLLAKPGDSTVKELTVYSGTDQVELLSFEAVDAETAADVSTEIDNLKTALKKSKYITLTASPEKGSVPSIAAASGSLTGGEDPKVTNQSYSDAWDALEPYYYNTIALDVDDDSSMSLSLMLQSYIDEAYKMGKTCIGVTGQKTSVDFATRIKSARLFDDEKIVFQGSGYKDSSDEDVDGALAYAYTAGLIAATLANQGITHTTISGATGLCESLTYTQYESAIQAGMLMLSLSPDGDVWYDSAINTLRNLATNQDAGWKKIRRVRTRFELWDRIDRSVQPKVGRINNDADGQADVIQTMQRVIDAMANEKKLFDGGTATLDENNPPAGDSAWFVITVVDIDSMERIYLHYQFSYSQSSTT